MKSWKCNNNYKIHQLLEKINNAYLIETPNYNLLIDTGEHTDYDTLVKNINSLLLFNKKIDFIILTHTHYDHCQNISKLSEKYKAKILCSINAKKFIIQGFAPPPKKINLIYILIQIANIFKSKEKTKYDAFHVDKYIVDNFSFNDYNLDINVIATPGHSIDSLSIIVNSEIAIVGDTFLGFFSNSCLVALYDDINIIKKSWRKLFDTNCNLFLPGHGNAIYKKNKYFEHLQ